MPDVWILKMLQVTPFYGNVFSSYIFDLLAATSSFRNTPCIVVVEDHDDVTSKYKLL